MRTCLREAIGVAQGDTALFSDCADRGGLWTGHGPREFRPALPDRAHGACRVARTRALDEHRRGRP